MSSTEVTFMRQHYVVPQYIHMGKSVRNEQFFYVQHQGKQICDTVNSALSKGSSVEEVYQAITTAFEMFSGLKVLLEQQICEKNMNSLAKDKSMSLPLNLSHFQSANLVGKWMSPNLPFSNNCGIGMSTIENVNNLKSSQADTAHTLSLLGENFHSNITNSVKRRKVEYQNSALVNPLISLARLKEDSNYSSESPSPNSPQTSNTDSASEESHSFNETVFIQESDPPESRRKRGRKKLNKSNLICEFCQTTETPEWRRGPNGPATLCNACGIRYANKKKKDKEVRMKGSIFRIVDPLVS